MEEIKSTAFLYFQGKISLEDEKVLFDFINDSNENMKLFRQWESEWISGYINEYEMADKCKYYMSELVDDKKAGIFDVSDDVDKIFEKLAQPLQVLENERCNID